MSDQEHLGSPFKPGTDGEAHWLAATRHPEDFTSWTYALQLADTEGDISTIRVVYDAFLAEYPLCYVYWRKFAEHEANHPIGDGEEESASHDRAVAVFERGVKEVAPSVDLWVHYASFLESAGTEPTVLTSLYERATNSPAGYDYLAGPLYDKYLDHCKDSPSAVSQVYRRLLSLPISGLDSYYERWKIHSDSCDGDALASQQEKEGASTAEQGDASLKEHVLKVAEEAYASSKAQLEGRLALETVLKQRTYFHYKPVDPKLLNAWSDLISLATSSSALEDPMAITSVFERCLVVCCNYFSFYKRYAYYLEGIGETGDARMVWERAARHALKHRPSALLSLALFEEACGEHDSARRTYEDAREKYPLHLEVLIRNAQFEGRTLGHAAVHEAYEAAISAQTSAVEKRFVTRKFGEYLSRVEGVAGTEGVPAGPPGAESEVTNGEAELVKSFEEVFAGSSPGIVDKAVRHQASASFEEKVTSGDADAQLWCDYLEFLHTFGDVENVRALDARMAFEKNLVLASSGLLDAAEGGKRAREEIDRGTATKVARVTPAPTVGGT